MNAQIDYNKSFNPVVLMGIVLLIIFTFSSTCYHMVDVGHVGVKKRLGAIQAESYPEGFHLKFPFLDHFENVDIRLTNSEAQAAAASKDLQTVQTAVSLQFAVNGAIAPKVLQGIGNKAAVATTVVSPAIHESVKAVTAQYTAEQLVTKRAEVKLQIQEAIHRFINVTLDEKDLTGAINIANFAITDFNFSDEFNRAIELKVRAEQEALQAKNEKIRRVTQAEAAAAEKNLEADANAYSIEMASKASADAIAREAKALKDNPELIQLRTIEKWSGQLPHYNGVNAVPFLDLEKK